jgi:formamidopyrimidine-DNA glycosylase
MADEILWQARLHPRIAANALSADAVRELWRVARSVCRVALRTIGANWSDPPADWLIHQRWKNNGHCPKHAIPLHHTTVGGRTSAWCPRCQKLTAKGKQVLLGEGDRVRTRILSLGDFNLAGFAAALAGL